jgi:hypothetical protein
MKFFRFFSSKQEKGQFWLLFESVIAALSVERVIVLISMIITAERNHVVNNNFWSNFWGAMAGISLFSFLFIAIWWFKIRKKLE